MFTGIVADVGTLVALSPVGRGARVTVATSIDLGACVLGDSIAVNGTCLTAVALQPAHGSGLGRFEAELSQETLDCTTFRDRRPGDRVNLELAARLGDRLGGHLMQGHVDGVGRLVDRCAVGEAWDLTFEIPPALLPQIVPKGSIALDGVSLTVARLQDPRVTIAVIPHTAEHTTLGALPVGAAVNVETDVIGKYVQRLLGLGDQMAPPAGLSLQTLKDRGFA